MVFLLGVVLASSAIANPDHRPVVQVEGGAVEGVVDNDIAAFKGIPYAAPPVGDLRWRPPAPLQHWQGVRDASHYGAACPQPGDHKEAWAQVGPTSEDCLFLNIWQPEKHGKYPVMVFLHGGGFTYGAAGVPLYDGTNLARRGVVVVTLNYRLGLLGFFAHPALTAENPDGQLGNYGVMDQIAALRWVKRNIAAFDGDASNVTLFGESAGAGVVQTLMGSPQSKGLFEKAISESGAGGAVLFPIRGAPLSAEALGAHWAASVGLPNATAKQLRALPVSALLQRSFPFIDGKVIVASPGAPFSNGTESKIPLIIGANSNEATLPSNNEAAARKVLGDSYDDALKQYSQARPGASFEAVKTDLAEDALSILPSYSIAAMHAANGAVAYDFYFDQVPSNRRKGSAGTPHGGELEYVFGNPDAGSVWDAGDRKVSDTIAGYWVRFASTGNPNGPGAPMWPIVSADGAQQYLVIGTPTRSATLSPMEEKVRQRSLATSRAGWSGNAMHEIGHE
ncbi:carboxylesterase family protein [Porphyrobacter algicida]|uniref:Carboxylesterase family protein n=1 Tax=Qipengyuania algicida TaxID=1836209 RepID=A0A845AKE3_9SPHN|nr:carboxylesterase family protein [Qipengyuania algicida]MXP29623.1 carboxylesterase family protein [Qipengyuania algicida]